MFAVILAELTSVYTPPEVTGLVLFSVGVESNVSLSYLLSTFPNFSSTSAAVKDNLNSLAKIIQTHI